jgi:hypothetical protein
MSYIGVPPAQSFTALLKQDFTTSATTSYTLDHSVNNANDIALFINFVRQEPTAAYSASGTSLTLTSATSASDDMYCVYLGQALQTVNPPSGSVGISQLSATGTKNSTTFLRGDNTFDTPSVASLSTASGSAPSYSARAWVQFDGTGSFTINGSGNVSSIGDAGVGIYRINFTTAMSDTNYVAVASAQSEVTRSLNTLTTSYAVIQTEDDAFNVEDSSKVDVAVFR